jgi:hypothetical protein
MTEAEFWAQYQQPAGTFSEQVTFDQVQGWYTSAGLSKSSDDINRIVSEINSGTRTTASVLYWITGPGAAVAPDDAEAPVGSTAPGSPAGVMGGGTLLRVTRPGQTDTWAIVYVYNGTRTAFVVPQTNLPGIYGDGWQNFIGGTVTEDWYDQNITVETTDLSPILGVSGQWHALFDEMTQQAAMAAGGGDPTLTGQIMNDPEVKAILAQAMIGNWSDQQIQAAMRSTNAYRTVLYPGIDTFIQMGSVNPEEDWDQYFDTVRAAAAQAGITVDRQMIQGLLSAGVSEQSFAASIPMYVRATQSAGFFNTFNQWTNQELGQSLDFETWMDFLEGKAPPDLYDIYEKATLQFSAEQVAPELAADPNLITRVAEVTDLTEGQARTSFLNAAQILRQLDRVLLLNKYGLTEDDLISLEFGIKPTTGRSLDEIAQRADQAITEEKLLGAPKGTFATDQFGRRTGLTPLNPIS